MTGRPPYSWELEKAISECMDEKGRFESLSALHEAVESKLSEKGFPKGTTPERIRRIGIGKGLFEFEIKYSRSGTPKTYGSCPVCGGKLKIVYNRTIDGEGPIAMSCSCSRCGYRSGSGYTRPCRYIVRRARWTGRRGSRPSEERKPFWKRRPASWIPLSACPGWSSVRGKIRRSSAA